MRLPTLPPTASTSPMKPALRLLAGLLLPALLPGIAHAAEFDGARLSPWWGVPFAGILLSIALMPLLAPSFWHHHFGKVAAGWALAFLVPFAALYGLPTAGTQLVHFFAWDEATFLRLTEGSPIRRIGHARWLRNVAVALGNALRASTDAAERAGLQAALASRAAHDSAVVREHVAWALAQAPQA